MAYDATHRAIGITWIRWFSALTVAKEITIQNRMAKWSSMNGLMGGRYVWR